jgi:MFS family permease
MLGFFTLGASFGNMFASLAGGLLLDFNGALGLAGWQWIFLGSASLSTVLAFLVWAFLPASPASAGFLSEGERSMLQAAHAKWPVRTEQQISPWAVFWDLRVLGFGATFVLLVTSFYGVSYWLPTIIHRLGVSPTVNGLLNMIPWAFSAMALVLVPRLLHDNRSIYRLSACIATLGACCFLVGTLIGNDILRFIALVVGVPCISLLNPCFWSFPSRYFSGLRAAASIAAINSIGNLGGFFAQNLAPWIELRTGDVAAPMIVPSVCLAVLGAGFGLLWFRERSRIRDDA